jgi:hypothetical protein
MRATDLLLWGIVVHLVIDWLAQNEWMAVNKAKRRSRHLRHDYGPRGAEDTRRHSIHLTNEQGPWWDRHPAAYVHAGLHGAAQLLVFPWWAALAIGVAHLLIDTRVPVRWWSKLIRQTQPVKHSLSSPELQWQIPLPAEVLDIGAEVRIWADQVWHIAVVAVLALVVAN